MRRILIFLLALILGWQLLTPGAVAAPAETKAPPPTVPAQAGNPPQQEKAAQPGGLKLEAKGAILMDAQSGKILWEQNAHWRGYPASMTKLMTLILAMEAIEKGQATLDEPVTASKRAADMTGSIVFLSEGETFPLEKMLLAIAVASGNDASVAVAEHLAGTEEAFVEMMNAKAKELGCRNTHFTNCHGLHDPNHYTTPYDMALMARYALKFPKLLEMTAVKRATFREKPLFILDTTNKMLYWYPGTDGLKTGVTEEAGLNLVSTVQRDDLRLIAVVMGVEKRYGHFTESMELYNWAFKRWAYKKFYDAGATVARVPVGKGVEGKVDAVTAAKVGTIIARGKNEGQGVTARLELPRLIDAPIKKGQKLGQVVVLDKGQEVWRVDLVAAKEVKKASLWQQILKAIKAVFGLS
ncbi:MAG: hypothetical protein PWP65_1873 [Clostridia bacterium]|nr:hypothetical protein [Clostridia bacterium]